MKFSFILCAIHLYNGNIKVSKKSYRILMSVASSTNKVI